MTRQETHVTPARPDPGRRAAPVRGRWARPGLLVLVLGLVLAGLAGCRTSPDVAAYTGDTRVTTAEVDAAVAEGLADDDVAAYAASLPAGDYPRQVLNLMVGARVHDEVVRRYGLEVTPAEVDDRITDLLAGQPEQQLFDQLAAQQGLLPADAREIIRQLLVREELAQDQGLADLSPAALQAGYAATVAAGGQFELGFLTVPDQAAADAAVAALTADPAGYPALAAQYPGNATLPAPQLYALADVPSALTDAVQGVLTGGVFSLPVAEAGGIVVGLVTVPTFEQLAPDLTAQARQAAAAAAQPLVDEVEADLDVTVNPRFGSLQDGTVVAGDGGAVRILSDAATASSAAAGD